MSIAKVYDLAGKELGEVTLADAVFGIEPNVAAVHAVVKNHLANLRQGTQSALTRAEVSGGGRKPWRQKGTGRARQGSTRSPQWTHGGVVFAPKPRSYAVIEGLDVAEPKTKTVVGLLNAIDAGKSVIITDGVKKGVVLSSRNIPGVVTTPANTLSVYDLVNAKTLVIDKAALATIEEVYA